MAERAAEASDVSERDRGHALQDITRKSSDDPPPWHKVHAGDGGNTGKPPWAPRRVYDEESSGRVPLSRKTRDFPQGDLELRPRAGEKEKEQRGEEEDPTWWLPRLRRWLCSRRRMDRQSAQTALSQALLSTGGHGSNDLEMGEEEYKVRRITASCYNAMEIHGFFGLVDDGPCHGGSGRMLIVHQPPWVRGQFLDIKDGDDIHVWHVAGTSGGVLRVLWTGRHRYYSPGQKVTTCTVCVREEQWERLMQ